MRLKVTDEVNSKMPLLHKLQYGLKDRNHLTLGQDAVTVTCPVHETYN